MAHYMTFKVKDHIKLLELYYVWYYTSSVLSVFWWLVVIIHTAKSPKMHLAEIFLLSSKCWQSLIIKIVVVAIVCQNIPWRCRAAASGLRDDLEPDESRGLRSRTRSSRGKVGRKRENMHNAIIIVDNALSIAREMTSMTSTTESRGNWRNWLSFEKKQKFLSRNRQKSRSSIGNGKRRNIWWHCIGPQGEKTHECPFFSRF